MNKSRLPRWSALFIPFILIGLTSCSTSPSEPTASTTSAKPEPQGPVTISKSTPQPKSRFETGNSRSGSSRYSEPATETQVKRESSGTLRMRAQHPKTYTVKKGDTLWDISSVFLKDPWNWPDIWDKNPQLDNPNLIYPGDVLTLVYIDGEPKILVNEEAAPVVESVSVAPIPATAESKLRVVKLSPRVRRDVLEPTIPVIPGDAIKQFIIKPRVVTKTELEKAPYILGSNDEHLVLSKGNRVYIRGELDKERVRYTVFRPHKELLDPKSEELLGYEAVYAGEVHIDTYGDPAVGTLTYSEREVLIGDRLLPIDKSRDNNLYLPHVPEDDVKASIVSLFDGLFGIAKYQVAVINKGSRDGLEVGHILETLTKGQEVSDKYNISDRGSEVEFPDERSGLIMIFRTFDQVSYALVMESTNVIEPGDSVRTPK